jgi:hypothetical protein
MKKPLVAVIIPMLLISIVMFEGQPFAKANPHKCLFMTLIGLLWKDRNPALHILSNEKVLWLKADFLIHQIVGAASIKAAVTVGGNVPLTFGKENSITNLLGMLEVKKE